MPGDPQPNGSRRPATMQDVAERAGVSRALVSLVMRGTSKVSAERREAVLRASAELSYRPNAAARTLARARTDVIGVMIDDLHNPFFVDVVDGIHEAADRHGMQIVLSSARRRQDGAHLAIEEMIEMRVEGVILIGSRARHSFVRATSALMPMVSVGVPIDDVDSIVVDDEIGATIAVDYLVGLGHRHIVHIDGGDGGGAAPRRVGFFSAMSRHLLVPRVVAGDFTERGGVEAIETMLAGGEPPQAILAANDLTAIGALGRLSAAGLRVPNDVSVVGYDNTSLASMAHLALTTIDQPRVEMGQRAVERIVERREHNRSGTRDHHDSAARRHALPPSDAVHQTITPSLVVRATAGPPRPSVEA